MVKYYKTDDRKIHEEHAIQTGVWVQMVNPSVAEGQMVADVLGGGYRRYPCCIG